VYLAKLTGHRQAAAPSRAGGRIELHCTAIGKALLAHAADDVVAAVLVGGLERRTPRTITVPRVLRDQLAQVRTDGVAFEYEESRTGLVCVGAPVFGARRQVVAALSVAGPVTRFHPARHAERVRGAARGIARALAAAQQ